MINSQFVLASSKRGRWWRFECRHGGRPARGHIFSLDGVFFWQRVLFGLCGPTVLAYLTWETAKIRSTQSATGILYVDFFAGDRRRGPGEVSVAVDSGASLVLSTAFRSYGDVFSQLRRRFRSW